MKKDNLFKIAGLIAIITIISKIAGFGRDVITAQAYGATTVSDAYFYAYQIPSFALILLGGLGGPFHTATISVFSKIIPDLDKKPPESVQKSLNSFITLTAIFFMVLTVLIWLFSDSIISIIAANGSPEFHHLASLQLKIMAPIMLIGGLVGILYGISNIYSEFLFTSLSPTIASIAVIAAILMFKSDTNGIVLAWGTMIGAIGQLLAQLPVFFKSGFTYRPDFSFTRVKLKFYRIEKPFVILIPGLDFEDRTLDSIKSILVPAMGGTTIGQANIYVDMFFASWLLPGTWTAIGYANRIFQFPVGIIITAMLVPLFPMFSGFVVKKDWDSLRRYFHKGLLSLWFISFPILAFIMVFSGDTIRLLMQRGHFTSSDTQMVALALIYLSISIIPYVARDTLTRIFYAFESSKTPFYIAMLAIIVKALINLAFIKHLGIGAITLSTTGITLLNSILLAVFIRRKIDLEFGRFIIPVARIILATLIMSGITWALKLYLDSVLDNTTVFLALKLGIYTVSSAITYLIAGILLKVDFAVSLAARIKGFVFGNSQADATVSGE